MSLHRTIIGAFKPQLQLLVLWQDADSGKCTRLLDKRRGRSVEVVRSQGGPWDRGESAEHGRQDACPTESSMTRRFWLKCLAWSIGWLPCVAFRRIGRGDEQQATLNELLRSVLKCRRPEE